MVGNEKFEINSAHGKPMAKCEIQITTGSGFSYEYGLLVNGKQFQKFRDKQSKVIRSWDYEHPAGSGKQWKIVLGEDSIGEPIEVFFL